MELFPEGVNVSTKVMFVNLGEAEQLASLKLMAQLRNAGHSCEIYPDAGKMKKQMEYANRRKIPYVVIIGSNELEAGKATVKSMLTGEQCEVAFEALAEQFD